MIVSCVHVKVKPENVDDFIAASPKFDKVPVKIGRIASKMHKPKPADFISR